MSCVNEGVVGWVGRVCEATSCAALSWGGGRGHGGPSELSPDLCTGVGGGRYRAGVAWRSVPAWQTPRRAGGGGGRRVGMKRAFYVPG
jgi:hypothetical protein